MPVGHAGELPQGDLLDFLLENFYPVDFVCCLAVDKASVVLPGYGFFEPEGLVTKKLTPADHNNWSIRVSLANLPTPAYTQLGENIKVTLKKYYKDYRQHSEAETSSESA